MQPSRLAAALALAGVLTLGGCGSSLDAIHPSPSATPTDFAGVTRSLAGRNLEVSGVVSGDPGCDDAALVPMAISFRLAGPGLDGTVAARIYRFKDAAAYDRLRTSVDRCAAAWVGDPATMLMVDASPYVLVADGAGESAAADAIRAALREAAGY